MSDQDDNNEDWTPGPGREAVIEKIAEMLPKKEEEISARRVATELGPGVRPKDLMVTPTAYEEDWMVGTELDEHVNSKIILAYRPLYPGATIIVESNTIDGHGAVAIDNERWEHGADVKDLRVGNLKPDVKIITDQIKNHNGAVIEIVSRDWVPGMDAEEWLTNTLLRKTEMYLRKGWAVIWLFCFNPVAQELKQAAEAALEFEFRYGVNLGTIDVNQWDIEPGRTLQRKHHWAFEEIEVGSDKVEYSRSDGRTDEEFENGS
ncbi:hypothetical protein [Natronorubrum sp. DTA7]|uniref:hypothetical protein n=1 Tax=Natronorubrum sp. DTA7 TaxID=3447016 RepID=UPI003F87E7C0